MHLSLEAWQKSHESEEVEEMGTVRMEISEREFSSLAKIERDLKESEEREAFLKVSPATLSLQPPRECGPLADCKIRVYLREEDDTGHFHLVGRRAANDAPVYTNSVMLRAVVP